MFSRIHWPNLDLFMGIWYDKATFKKGLVLVMTEEKKAKLHTILSLLTAAAILVTAAALIISCVGIYLSGDHPFSRETVGKALGNLAVPGILCVLLILLGLALPKPKQKLKFRPMEKKSDKAPADLKKRLVIRTIVAVCAVALIVMGIFNGGYEDVLNKAIRICTECIGLG